MHLLWHIGLTTQNHTHPNSPRFFFDLPNLAYKAAMGTVRDQGSVQTYEFTQCECIPFHIGNERCVVRHLLGIE